MDDNIVIEEVEFSEELYQKNIQENRFENLDGGIGDEIDANN